MCTGSSASCPADDPGDGCPDASCRTAGYWGTHAGIEKERQGSLNVTLMSIALAGGSIEVCGQTLDDTDVESASSAVEGLCEGGGGITQLARQLIAMSLNCINSESPADCSGVPEWTSTFSTCDAACADGTNSDLIGECINVVDCFNNGGQPSLGSEGEFLCSTGNCSDNGADCNSGNKGLCEDSALATCTPYEFTCHMNPLLYPDSPAGSSKACNKANKSDCTIFDAGLCDNP
jgi:hypothetical protein